MNKLIIWEKPDGRVMVTAPAEPQQLGETEAEYYTRIADKARAAIPFLADATHRATIGPEEWPTDAPIEAVEMAANKISLKRRTPELPIIAPDQALP